jgi:hypothetical protein
MMPGIDLLSPWPVVSKTLQNATKYSCLIQREAQQLLEVVHPTTTKLGQRPEKKRAIPAATVAQFLESVIQFFKKGTHSNN